ncbi:hypothetical protein H310_03930 [Aphanomyces invadans]|uniref:Lipase maturation factor 2 n=1 Tax=Aphanomyces invadans TaxID=157072 RepID=A0A024UGM8_9STRA|nr:hypothetical protein H310_03930 [Aphanomyces invadans]ETW04793.1 hypothetical protein H310_03930 [Aphanomyces invadans]|eukprot:XP_008866231.1 hypothetical protein H310_03930 [Aphanomyces invadans]
MVTFRPSVFLQALGLIYAIAFCSLYSQVQCLYGPDGLEPVAPFMTKIQKDLGDHPLHRFLHVPSLVWFHDSVGLSPDLAIELVCLVGMVLGTLAAANIILVPESFGAMWLSYLSVVLMGGSFIRCEWDALLLEVGFLAIWMAPPFSNATLFEPPQVILWALRFVFVKFSLMASASKILSGCPTWLGLTALDYHFATQEVPNPLSWYAHQLSPGVHSVLAAASLFIQGPLTLLSLSPSAWHRYPVFYLNLALHLSSLFTGNYGFSNVLAISLAYTVLPSTSEPSTDRFTAVRYAAIALGFAGLLAATYSMFELVYENGQVAGLRYALRVGQTKHALQYVVPGVVWGALGVALAAAVWQNARLFYAGCVELTKFRLGASFASGHCAVFSLVGLLVLGGLTMPLAQMHPGFSETLPGVIKTASIIASRLHVSAAYGSTEKSSGVRKVMVQGTFANEFAIVARPEVVLEGSADGGKTWHALDLHFKPGSVDASPSFVAPHQSRIDWQMAAAAKGNYSEHPWLVHFVMKVLQGSPAALGALHLDKTPFSTESPPKAVRAQLYNYDFTRWNTSWARNVPHVEVLRTRTNSTAANGTALASPWWTRTFVKEYLPAVDLNNPSLNKFIQSFGWPPEKVASDVGVTYCTTASTHPKLCHSLVTLHSIRSIRLYLMAAIAVFMVVKHRLDRWLTRNDVAESTDKTKLD